VRGYAYSEVFGERERHLLLRATELVRCLPERGIDGGPLRCHEVARVVGKLLGLEVADGYYGFVEHSWCWTGAFEPNMQRYRLPNILDPYVPGHLPQVQLVSLQSALMSPYRHGKARGDVRHGVVEHLCALFRGPE
jgi:hypothetical protein